MTRRMWWWSLLVELATATTMQAQFVSTWGGGDWPTEPNPSYDGRYAFVRLRYREELNDHSRCEDGIKGPGWRHDYPVAERSLMKTITNLTALDAHADSSLVLFPDDPKLLKYPIAYLAEPGCGQLTDSEVMALRAYLRKGGFLIVDDMAHPTHAEARRAFEEQIQRVLPDGRLVTIDRSDPLFTGFFDLEGLRMPQLASARTASDAPEYRGIYEDNDPTKRLLVAANYNNDISEYWYYRQTSAMTDAGVSGNLEDTQDAYKLGVNYIIYGFVH